MTKRVTDSFSHTAKKLKKLEKQHHFDKLLVSSLNKSKIPKWSQLKHFSRILSKKERILFNSILSIVGFCFLLVIFGVYQLNTISTPIIGGDYTEGLIGSPKLINPVLAQTESDLDISRLVFSGLLKYDKNHQLIPDLAESYEVSEDGLVYTFHLRKGVKWQDGEPFKADDIIFTISAIQNPEFRSPLSRSFRGVEANKIDDYTVTLTLKESFAPFLSLMNFGILPEHLWYSIAPANSDLTELNKKPIGTGAWSFEGFTKDKSGIIKSYTLIPNKDYYGEKPKLKKIIFKFYGDFISAIEALKSKNVDGLAYLPKEFRNELKKYKNLNYNQLSQPQYTAVFFNLKGSSLLSSDYIRQALALATDKNKIVTRVLNGEADTIESPVLPGVQEIDAPKYAYNPQSAAQLLEDNGWKLISTSTGDGLTEQVRSKKGQLLQITLTVVNQQQTIETAQLIKESWDQIGIKTIISVVEKEKIFQDVINPRKYEALIFSENLGSDPDPFAFWHSSQADYPGLNLSGYNNKKADQILESARKINDWSARQGNYLELKNILAKDLPAIFLYNLNYVYPQDKKIKGFSVSYISAPNDRFSNISDWYIKTKRIWK